MGDSGSGNVKNSNPFVLLRYVVESVRKHYLTLKELVQSHVHLSSYNITNQNDIQIINMPGNPPGPDDPQFIIVTSDFHPPDDDAGAGAIRIPIIPVSATSQADNILLSLARLELTPLSRITTSIMSDIGEDSLLTYINNVIEIVKSNGGRRRSSSAAAKKRASARRATKKRASARRGRQRHSRRRGH